MLKKIGISSAFILFFALCCMAADLITGRWDGVVSTPNGDMAISYNLKVDGDKLTGTLSTDQGDLPISDGKVTGDDISFKITFNDLVIPHQGKVAGDTLKMKITIQDNVVESKFLRAKK